MAANPARVTTRDTSRVVTPAGLAAKIGVYDIHEVSEFPDDYTAAGLALLDDTNAEAQRTTLGVAIGVDVMAYEAWPIHEVEELCSVD